MLRAVEAAERVRGRHVAQPVGRRRAWCRRPAEGVPVGVVHRGDRAAGRSARRGGGAGRGRRAGPRAAPCTSPSSRAPTTGRTPPCTDADRGRRGGAGWWSASTDPDPQVDGRGIAALRAAGVEVEVGVAGRRGGRAAGPVRRPTGAPAGRGSCSSWRPPSTGASPRPTGRAGGSPSEEARLDAHRLRAVSDAVLVGAGHRAGRRPVADRAAARGRPAGPRPGRAAAAGGAGAGARRARPCCRRSSSTGRSEAVLDDLGAPGMVQVLVEGGATVAHDFHAARTGRPLRPLPGPGPVRRRRRPAAVRRAGGAHDRRPVAGRGPLGD